MRGKSDAKLNRRLPGRKPKPPAGGKVLQRLFNYLAQRDPALNDEVVASIPVPKAARQRFGLTRRALSAGAPTAAQMSSSRRKAAPATSFAKAIIKAADSAAASTRRKRGVKGKRAKAKIAAPGAPGSPWQPIGPSVVPNGQTYGTNSIAVIGRVACIAVDPSNAKHVLVGAAGGGIWESANAGTTWSPRSDQMPSLAIGAITFDPSNPHRVYAGSGEGNFYWNLGAGVYRSTDGGTTWTVIAQAPFVGVGFFRLVVDPATPSTLYAATTSGFFKSTNSGVTWTSKRAVQCWDVSVHPAGGTTEVLAAFGDGLFVSTNSGNTFAAVSLPAAPSAAWARLAVDRVTTSPDIAYVFGAAGTSAYLWRRQGTTWKKLTTPTGLSIDQAWYDWYVVANPASTAQVFLGAIDGYRGDLVGTTWKWTDITTQGANSIHPDQHCLTLAPNNPKTLYAGSDGGIFQSIDSGAHWQALNKGLGITEIEYIAGNPTTWQWLMAGTQDNGTLAFTGTSVWKQIAMGDGGDCGVNQLSPNTIYHSYYNVSLERSNNQGGTWTSMNPPSMGSLFYPPVEVFGATVAIGGTSLLVTRNGAPPWKTVSLGLGTNEVCTAMRDVDANTIVVGTNKGRVIRASWNGASWTKTVLTTPAARYISCIAVDPSNPQRYWVTFSQVGGASVYRSDNGGSTWVNCTASLPSIPMNAVVVDPANFKRVWVAADVGVYQSLNLGTSWSVFGAGLPNAIAADLLIHKQDRKLVCATRSRGAWVIDVP